MSDRNADAANYPDYYHFEVETWSVKKCEHLAKHVATDGLGTPYPFCGYIGSGYSIPPRFGPIRYNGGVVAGDEWYPGEYRPFPNLPEGFEIVYVSTWGWRLIDKRKENNNAELRPRNSSRKRAVVANAPTSDVAP